MNYKQRARWLSLCSRRIKARARRKAGVFGRPFAKNWKFSIIK